MTVQPMTAESIAINFAGQRDSSSGRWVSAKQAAWLLSTWKREMSQVPGYRTSRNADRIAEDSVFNKNNEMIARWKLVVTPNGAGWFTYERLTRE